MAASKIEQAILDRVAKGIHERLGVIDRDAVGRLDPEWIAAAMLSAIPAEHPFDELGPFYDTGGLVRWLGVSRQALHHKVKAHHLLAPTTSNGQRVYPAWQFAPDGKLLPGLPAVLRVLLAATDAWTAAIWLTTPSARLGEKSAIDLLSETRALSEHAEPLSLVLDAARADAAQWAR